MMEAIEDTYREIAPGHSILVKKNALHFEQHDSLLLLCTNTGELIATIRYSLNINDGSVTIGSLYVMRKFRNLCSPGALLYTSVRSAMPSCSNVYSDIGVGNASIEFHLGIPDVCATKLECL